MALAYWMYHCCYFCLLVYLQWSPILSFWLSLMWPSLLYMISLCLHLFHQLRVVIGHSMNDIICILNVPWLPTHASGFWMRPQDASAVRWDVAPCWKPQYHLKMNNSNKSAAVSLLYLYCLCNECIHYFPSFRLLETYSQVVSLIYIHFLHFDIFSIYSKFKVDIRA